MATQTKPRKTREKRPSAGRPTVGEQFGPLAERPPREHQDVIPVYLWDHEVLAIERMARTIGMERCTFSRAVLRELVNVGIDGVIDLKKITTSLTEAIGKWEQERLRPKDV